MKNNKLSQEEKNLIFENVWQEYSKDDKKTVYILMSLAAAIFISLSIFSISGYNSENNYPAYAEEIVDYEDIYQDEEIVFDETINNLTNSEMDEILAKL